MAEFLTREEVEAKGFRLLELREQKAELVSRPLSQKETLFAVEAATEELVAEDRETVAALLVRIRGGQRIEAEELVGSLKGGLGLYAMQLAKEVSEEMDFGEATREGIHEQVERLEKEEESLIHELCYGSDSPAWPEERRGKDENGRVTDAWWPQETLRGVPLENWTLAFWLRALKERSLKEVSQ